MIIPDQTLSANGTCLKGYVVASFSRLRELFGEPIPQADGYKVSTEWVLNVNGHVATIYDYKCTNLYDDEMESVEEFRARESYEWHIGTHDADAERTVRAVIDAVGGDGKVGW